MLSTSSSTRSALISHVIAGDSVEGPEADFERGNRVTDVLIRDLPDDVLAGVDARASKLGISRVEYIRRRLAADAAATTSVSVAQLRTFSAKIADLADPEVMDAAWR